MNWVPIWALPNINLETPIENEFFALVPSSDQRVQSIKRKHTEFRRLMIRFYDTFRNRINPTLILRHTDAPEHLNSVEAAASFRDLLVASTVPYAWSRSIIYDNTRSRAAYSDFFWLHPWMVSKDFKYIIGSSPAMLATHGASEFRGQTSPGLSPITLTSFDFDKPLLRLLLQRWSDRYVQNQSSWSNLALFRSLNMANQASLIPAGSDVTIYEYGRNIALWVAAFEILVHPGGNGQANQRKVYDLLEKAPWINPKNRHKRFEIFRSGKMCSRRNLACWIYKQLYSCRNDFLHGNPVDTSKFMIPKSRRILNNFAPILYRHGLASFLGLSWTENPPPISDTQAVADYLARQSEFLRPQHEAEDALQLSRVTVADQRRQRQLARQRRSERQIL